MFNPCVSTDEMIIPSVKRLTNELAVGTKSIVPILENMAYLNVNMFKIYFLFWYVTASTVRFIQDIVCVKSELNRRARVKVPNIFPPAPGSG